MRTILASTLLASAAPAFAAPMLDKCLPLAPKVCALTDKSAQADYLSCFENIKLSPVKPAEAACTDELAHARVHNACDASDIPKVCAGVKPGENRVMGCLRKNKQRLGDACRKELRAYDAILPPKIEGGKKGERKKGHSGVGVVRC